MSYYNINNGVITEQNGNIIDNMAIVYDSVCGCLLKHGDVEYVKEWYDTVTKNTENQLMCYLAKDFELIDYTGSELTKEEICTLVNYLLSTSAIPEVYTKLFSMNISELKEEISKM